ncbi:unnamed protein product [Closterium sp. NIES-54]
MPPYLSLPLPTRAMQSAMMPQAAGKGGRQGPRDSSEQGDKNRQKREGRTGARKESEHWDKRKQQRE